MKKRGIVFLVLVLSLFLVSAVSFSFSSPDSETDQDSVSVNFNFFNVTGLLDFVFNWGSSNYSVYDEDLILMMDFNNDSDLGENDSVVADLSRYGHNGSVLGGAVSTGDGKYNGAYSFSEGEGINISASEDFNVDEFTISLWVKSDKTKTVLDLDSRDLHTCYIDGNRDAWCYGDNTAGKLGDGTITENYLPVRVSGNYKFREIAVSEDASCGILINDSVVCWGRGGTGELGRGLTTDSSVPVFVNTNLNFTSLTSSNHLMCGYLENGSAVCWGYGSSGQFGDGVSSNRLTPAFIAPTYNFTQYAFGEVHTCGILYNGTVYCWGNNHEGERGDNSTLDTAVNIPVPVLTDNYTFKWIDAGEDANCGVLTNGSLMCWGENNEFQLGVQDIKLSLYPIFSNTSLDNFERVYLSKHLAFGFLENGSVVAWGCSITQGSYGDGSYECSTSPKIINWDFDYNGETLTNPVWNSEHYCFINEDLPYCWGENKGNNGLSYDIRSVSFPVKFSIKNNLLENYEEIYFGSRNYCFKKNSKFYCAGYNLAGNLGVGELETMIYQPKEVLGNYNFIKIYKTAQETCGLLQNGSALCWGYNLYGQIGDNTTEDKEEPTFVYGNNNFSLLSFGGNIGPVCGLLQNGSALCWGYNLYGQVGDNSTENRLIPTPVYGNYNFSLISSENTISCGLLQNGSALCWGRNNYGQLGNGSTGGQSEIPVFVYGNYNFSKLSAGRNGVCGLLQNGSALCWGYSNYGQVGDGGVCGTTCNTPQFVSGNYIFLDISAGTNNFCGLLQNGSALCWGYNNQGQLGTGNYIQSNVPVFVMGNLIFSEIYISPVNFFGIINNSKEIYSFGENVYPSSQTGEEFLPISNPISIYRENLISKDENEFRIGLTYDGNLRSIYGLRHFDYDLINDWNNVILSVGETVKLYINGELVYTHEGIIFPNNLNDLDIGTKSSSEIDDLMMWNRSLSDSEIEFIYKSNLEKLNETSWSFTTSFSDLAEATYIYGAYVSDDFGWVSSLRNLVVNFPDVVRGGSSTGDRTTLNFNNGVVSRGFPKGHILNFEKGELKVDEFDNIKISFSFDSKIVEVEMGNGEKIDLDGDEFYDVEIFYSGSTGNFADLIITEIHEKISPIVEDVVVDSNGKIVEVVDEKRVGFFGRIWNWFKNLFRR
jgi:alpha-tubulin suppressor-like RCC1 family protein